MLVAGYGFADNAAVWLPWVELRLGPSVALGGVRLGVHLGISPLDHEVSTQSGSERGGLSRVRLSLGVEFPLLSGRI